MLSNKTAQNLFLPADIEALQFTASSPDELALIDYARFCGVYFLGQDMEGIIHIQYNNEIYKFKFLNEMGFSSLRSDLL